MKDGTEVLIRPIRPEDSGMEEEFIEGLSEESAFFRFFGIPREPSPEMVARLCNIDYEKEMAVVAETSFNGKRVLAGVARMLETTLNRAEFAVVVADEFQGRGLGGKLTSVMLEFARERRLSSVYAAIVPENTVMISLAKKFGFRIVHEDAELVIAELPLSG
jgi:acetyltransferase